MQRDKNSRNTRQAASDAVAVNEDDPDHETLEEFVDAVAVYAWQPALRLVQRADNAVERCSRRLCRLSGRCHLTVSEGKPPRCGAGVSDEALSAAASHLVLACTTMFNLIEHGRALRQAEIDAEARAKAESGVA